MSEPLSAAEHAEYAEYSGPIRWIILIAVMLGTLMQAVDTSIVNVSIPTMMGNMGVTLDQISWVTTGYIIANVIFLPLTGWLSAHFGRKRYLAWSMIIFTIASFFCGTSHSLNELIFFRVLQGAGGAALVSTAQATMMEVFPPAQLGIVQGLYAVGVMVGPALGPTLGGWITDNYSWPWIFFINLPIGAIAATMTLLFVHDSKHQKRGEGTVDFIGIGFLAVGLGCLQAVLEKGNREDWFSSTLICWLSVLAVVGLAAFIYWELHVEHPAVNLRVLKDRGLAVGTIFGAVVGFGLFSGVFVLPVFLQQLRHYTAMQTGIIMLPGALASAIAMPIIGRFVMRFSARLLVFIGVIQFIISLYWITGLTMDTSGNDMLPSLILRGVAMGFLFIPLTMATLTGLRGKEIAEGTGLFSLSRQLGGSAGIAVVTAFLSRRVDYHRAMLVEHLNPFNISMQLRLHQMAGAFKAHGASPSAALKQAFNILDHTVMGQAMILAFNDVFFFTMLLFIAATPLLLLFDKATPAAQAKREKLPEVIGD